MLVFHVLLFYCHLVYFVAIRNILWLFGIFSNFGMLYREKSGNPDRDTHARACIQTKTKRKTEVGGLLQEDPSLLASLSLSLSLSLLTLFLTLPIYLSVEKI
jgi:hypothetical protein